jgi:Uma2 family endonuclease
VAVATSISLEEFLSNPDIHYYDFHELHNGEVVVVSPPSDGHSDLQDRLQELLRPLLTVAGYLVRREYYYTLPSNSRRADVAALLQSRRNLPATFRGGPDLVVEILSPSNKALDLDQLRTECFAEGTREFWIVNATLYTVLVYSRAHGVRLYTLADGSIPLDEFVPGAKLSLAKIFE